MYRSAESKKPRCMGRGRRNRKGLSTENSGMEEELDCTQGPSVPDGWVKLYYIQKTRQFEGHKGHMDKEGLPQTAGGRMEKH